MSGTSATKIITRRDLLTRGLGLMGVGSGLPNFLIRSALAGPKACSQERIMVALLLTGGHDGLSDVPPYADDAYYRYRTTTRIHKKEVIKLNDEVGLHPNLTGFKELYDQGSFGVVLGTGYPNFNLSHFVSRDIWQAGDRKNTTGKTGSTGWLGRYLDHAYKQDQDAKRSVAVGPARMPLIVVGKDHPGIGFNSPDSFRFAGDRSSKGQALYRELNEMTLNQIGSEQLQFVTKTAVNANASSQSILDMISGHKTSVEYPDTQFGNSLRTIAALIGRGLNTRVYYAAQGIAKFGGFDTHANQRPRHDQLMAELCQSVSAFQKDLEQQGNADRVLTFTFSDFGRRVKENNSGGTDHGLAQPMFLFGPGVKAGVHGKQPSLTDLANDNLKMQVDFRSIYAAILEKWLDTPSEVILGKKYPLEDCIA
jgi:uncharacterized protein (DUF1501 family)